MEVSGSWSTHKPGIRRTMRRAVVTAGLLLSAFGAAEAATCMPTGAPVIDLSSFQAAPASLLIDSASPETVEKQVGQYVSQDVSLKTAVLGVVSRANADMKKAIGSGLAQALVNCQRYNALEAFKLQEDVVKLGDNEVLAAFMTGSNSFRAFALTGGNVPSLGAGDEGGGVHKNDTTVDNSSFSPGSFNVDGLSLFTAVDNTTFAAASKSP